MLVSLVIAHHGARGGGPLELSARIPVAVVVAALALLMVSTFRYRTFKDLRLSKRSATAFMVLCVAGVLIATQLHPAYVLAAYFGAYLLLGFVESGVLLGRHLVARRVAANAAALAGEEEDDDDEDEDEDDEPDDVDEQDFL